MQDYHNRNRKYNKEYSYTWPPKMPDPIPIERYLIGTPFPVNKQDLIAYAKGNDAPESILKTLACFENKYFHTMRDVSFDFEQKQDSIC